MFGQPAKSRWDLRKALKLLYGVISHLKLNVHEDKKRFIGRIDKGFSFLGYLFTPWIFVYAEPEASSFKGKFRSARFKFIPPL